MDQVRNPQTGRFIKKDGPTFKKLVKEGVIDSNGEPIIATKKSSSKKSSEDLKTSSKKKSSEDLKTKKSSEDSKKKKKKSSKKKSLSEEDLLLKQEKYEKKAMKIFSMEKKIPELRKLGEKYKIPTPSKLRKSELIDFLRTEYVNKKMEKKRKSSKKEETKEEKKEESSWNLKTEKQYLNMLSRKQIKLKDVPELYRTFFLCYNAVALNGLDLEFVPEIHRTDDLNFRAVMNNGMALQFVPVNKRTLMICLMALSQNGLSAKYVPMHILNEILMSYQKSKPQRDENAEYVVPEKPKGTKEQERKYKYLVSRLHPDRNPDPNATKIFQNLNEQYQKGNFSYIEMTYDGYMKSTSKKSSSRKSSIDLD